MMVTPLCYVCKDERPNYQQRLKHKRVCLYCYKDLKEQLKKEQARVEYWKKKADTDHFKQLNIRLGMLEGSLKSVEKQLKTFKRYLRFKQKPTEANKNGATMYGSNGKSKKDKKEGRDNKTTL